MGRSRWNWTLWGKHPSAADYLNRGLTTRVEQAISNWIQKGYSQVNIGEDSARTPCVWRFWTRATGSHAIACGIICNSADRIGRPYPLLIMGTGKLKGWELHWEYLPMGLESTWRQMEQLSASRADQFGVLDRMLDRFQPPVLDWSIYNQKKSISADPSTPLLPETRRLHRNQGMRTVRKVDDFHQIVRLKDDSIDAAMEWHYREKAKHHHPPGSLFMGGPVDKPCLAAYSRALSPSDFVFLWTL